MQKYILPALVLLLQLFACNSTKHMQNTPGPNESGTLLYDTTLKPQLVSNQFSFTEGPATDKEGNIFFTDQPNNHIWKYDTDGKLTLFMDNAGRSNGMYFDKAGNLISCADEHNQLWSISPDKKVKVLVKDFEGKLLNGPNDVWVDRNTGGIYFTDPYYQRDYWERKSSELSGMNVYYLAPGSEKPVMVCDSLKRPNGITGTPDGKYLYVADIGDNKTYRFERTAAGQLVNRQLFVNQGSDGMTIDSKGNLYLTGKGVTVYDPSANKIAFINIPQPWTANLCIGGRNRDILFITASKAVFTVKLRVRGVE